MFRTVKKSPLNMMHLLQTATSFISSFARYLAIIFIVPAMENLSSGNVESGISLILATLYLTLFKDASNFVYHDIRRSPHRTV